MRLKAVIGVSLLAIFASWMTAQEGHPLTGSWHGEWHPSATQKTPLFVYMKWNSKNVEGTINPGPMGLPLKTVTLDPSKWTVHLEANGVTADGKLDNIGSYNRTITGTWTQGNVKGDFKLTRD